MKMSSLDCSSLIYMYVTYVLTFKFQQIDRSCVSSFVHRAHVPFVLIFSSRIVVDFIYLQVTQQKQTKGNQLQGKSGFLGTESDQK